LHRKKRQLSTTTWPQRHVTTFAELTHWIKKLGMDAPTVLEVGPGAVSAILAGHLAAGEGSDLSWPANRWRAVLRNLDSIFRRLPGTALHSYEPGELLQVLPQGSTLTVVDISERVIDAIRKQYPQVQTCLFDFSTGRFDRTVDVIVCLCVLVRAAEGREIFSNLYNSLRPGGLLVIDNRSCTKFVSAGTPLEKLASQIWRKSA